jgi:predicted PurR-regulated permease PerM
MTNPFYGIVGDFAFVKILGTFLVSYLIVFFFLMIISYVVCLLRKKHVGGKVIKRCAIISIVPAVIITACVVFVLAQTPMLIDEP